VIDLFPNSYGYFEETLYVPCGTLERFEKANILENIANSFGLNRASFRNKFIGQGVEVKYSSCRRVQAAFSDEDRQEVYPKGIKIKICSYKNEAFAKVVSERIRRMMLGEDSCERSSITI